MGLHGRYPLALSDVVRAVLLAWTAAWMVACGDNQTYYPIKFSFKQHCDGREIHTGGGTRKRFAVALEWESSPELGMPTLSQRIWRAFRRVARRSSGWCGCVQGTTGHNAPG